jgi:hypothetical protein
MQRHFLPGRMTIIALSLLMSLFAACGVSTTTVVSSPGSSTSSPTSVPGGGTATPSRVPPTATSVPANCATLLPGAGTASAGSSFADAPFPAGAVSGPVTPHAVGIGPGMFNIYLLAVCAQGTDASALRSFYAGQMPAHGWAYSATLPFDGQFEAACGDAYCWGKDHAPRLVGLESVTEHGSAVTFTLRLFTPPAAPNCGTLVFGGPGQSYTILYHSMADLPLPPLTQVGSGHHQTHLQESPLCSSGQAVAVNSFFTQNLAHLGWANGHPSPVTYCSEPAGTTFTGYTAWIKGSRALYIRYGDGGVISGTSGDLIYCAPDI